MLTFFAIILVLIVVNTSLLFFSNSNSKEKAGETTDNLSSQKPSNIYPLDLDSSEFKKAI